MNNSDLLFEKRNAISFSLWLMPDGGAKKFFQKTINKLSENYRAPAFEPHITLIGGFLGIEKDLLIKTELLARQIKSFKLSIKNIGISNQFFQSLFLKVQLSKDLYNARKLSCIKLGLTIEGYEPHLSLLYGKYTTNEKRKMFSIIDNYPKSFIVNKIYLAHNNEINFKWKVLKGFPLAN